MRTARSHDKFKKLIVVSFGDRASTGDAAVWCITHTTPGRHGHAVNTLYVIAVMTSPNCGVEVLCLRAVEPDSTGEHAQTCPTLDACIAARAAS